jgi:hypothetical protein
MGAVGADLEAGSARDTPTGMEEEFGVGIDGLGVMTPDAAEATSLQEDRSADAGAIVYGKALDVEDPALGRAGDAGGFRFGGRVFLWIIGHG